MTVGACASTLLVVLFGTVDPNGFAIVGAWASTLLVVLFGIADPNGLAAVGACASTLPVVLFDNAGPNGLAAVDEAGCDVKAAQPSTAAFLKGFTTGDCRLPGVGGSKGFLTALDGRANPRLGGVLDNALANGLSIGRKPCAGGLTVSVLGCRSVNGFCVMGGVCVELACAAMVDGTLNVLGALAKPGACGTCCWFCAVFSKDCAIVAGSSVPSTSEVLPFASRACRTVRP